MRKLTTLSFLVAAAAASVLAQQGDPGQMAMQYGESSKQNAMALRQYSWKMRVAVTVEGEPKASQLYQMSFDVDGKSQKTPIAGEEEKKKKKKVRGPVRKRVVGKKMSKAKEYVGKVSDLVKTYAHPTPGNMFDFFSRAAFAPTAAGQVEIKGADFLQPGDSATFWIDSATGQTRTYAFRTSMEGDPVNGQVDFQTLQNGPSYPARVSISVPGKSLRAVVENFDYFRQ